MQRRSVWSVLMLLIVSLSLSACGGSGPAAQPAANAGGATGSTQGGAAAPVVGPAATYGEPVEAPGGSYQLISPEDLEQMLVAEDITVINAEPKPEAQIEGTDLFIPYAEIPQHLGEISDREAMIVLYSADGEFSKKGAEKLVSFGYSGIYDLDGGTEAWEAAGLPLLPAGE